MNVPRRLEIEAPEIVQKAIALSEDDRHAYARVIAALACKRTGAVDDLDQQLASFVGDLKRSASNGDKAKLAAELERFDELYFETMDESEDGSATEVGLRWFSKARAVASLIYALDAAELLNFCEAVYEAHAAIGDWEEIRTILGAQ